MVQLHQFLDGGGRVGALMRARDWSTSPLGPPEEWPRSLQTVVELLLQSRFPMFVAWGKELGFLYNDPYAEILGAKHPAALGRRFQEIWSEIWSDIYPLIDAAMAGQATYREDLPLVMNRKGFDEQTWFTFSYSPVRDESGQVAGMFCAVSETTQKVLAERALRESEGRLRGLNETLERRVNEALAERSETEAALRQAQKMDSLGQLTGGIAHDFNNLLSVFAGGLQLLEHSVGQPPPPRVFEAMRRAVARGTGLTRHLLAFSRRHAVNPEALDVATHLKGMRAMLDASLGGDIEVQMGFGEGVGPVEVDAGELELAILNLCLNARDAMAGGGVISITVENVEAETETAESAGFVKISVSDTGHGMSPEVQARIFEPFFTTKGISKGSGLGLPQVYGFVQQSAGRITVDSEVGVGTIVTVLLPRSLRDPVATQPAGVGSVLLTRPDGGRRGHVLLVEDDREVATLTRELLASLGFAVTHAAGAEAALDALVNAHQIDVVLSDIMMPGGVSGLQLAREIRNRHPRLPIILTTGYVEAAADLKDGEFHLLPKPFGLETLADALGVEVK
jgi:signal transduction histidine kinase